MDESPLPTFEDVISPRIRKHCLPLFMDKHYKNAAREAMVQVELALKEKGKVVDRRFGRKLIQSVFSLGDKWPYIKLQVPFGDNLQNEARNWFDATFSYYRNYIAHDGRFVDRQQASRILVLASELLGLIDASSLSYVDLGGIEGIVKSSLFESKQQIKDFLQFLDGRHLPDGDAEGLRDEMFERFGLINDHLNCVIDLDLIRYSEDEYVPTSQELRDVWQPFSPPKTIGSIELTELGSRVLQD